MHVKRCTPFSLKNVFLYSSSFTQPGGWCSFSPPVSLFLPIPEEPFVLNNTPLLAAPFTSSCFVCFLCEHLEFTGAWTIYQGLYPWRKGLLLPLAPQGRTGLLSPSPTCDRQTHFVQVLCRCKLMSAMACRVQNTAFHNPTSILGSNVRLYLDLLCADSFDVFSSLSQ